MSSTSSPTDTFSSSSSFTPSSPTSSSGPSHLSISTTDTSTNQSSTRHRAQPPPKRTASEPLSAKALRFASVDLGGKKNGSGEREKDRGGINRRHSADEKKRKGSGKTNGYTECGRHGDEWLFGGWGKLWGKG